MRLALLAAASLGLAFGGCAEWLDLPPPERTPEAADESVILDLAGLPDEPPRVAGEGTELPGTPGLRVPRGYMTHARLDSADFLLGHTWAAVDATRSPGAQPAPRTTLRLVATGPAGAAGGIRVPSIRAVFPLALPEGTRAEDLAGFTVREEGLAESRVGIRTGGDHHWMIEPTRLSIELVTSRAIKGSFEGKARRGAKSDKTRSFRAGFVALRSPAR
jgi:hypothetical protein